MCGSESYRLHFSPDISGCFTAPSRVRGRLANPARNSLAVNSPEVFYLHINGEQRGPYTVQHIDHLLNSGLIAEDTLFWREGLEQWQPVTILVARKKRGTKWIKRWARPALLAVAIIALLLAVLLRIFGPIALDGWRESSQTEYTADAAYWRARDFVRHSGVEKGAVVQFLSIKSADVKLQPPDSATVILQGKVIEPRGGTRKGAWRVGLKYHNLRKEWTKDGIEQVSPAS